jgi:nitroreductase
MDVYEAMRTSGTCREYRPDPVPDDVLAKALDAARFAPTGGNRQPVRFVVVRDAATKAQLREWYVARWKPYLEGLKQGAIAIGRKKLDSPEELPPLIARADYFAEHLDQVPVLIVVCARLADVHPTDHQLGRLSVVGGASIYPAVQNLLTACRAEGLGTCLTTLLCLDEPKVKELLDIPEDVSTAATVAVGYPARPFPRRLHRRPLNEIAFAERYGRPIS